MYSTFFKKIVQTMHNDYAGYIDKQGWDNPAFFGKKIEELNEKDPKAEGEFITIVKDYLVDFKDQHLFIVGVGAEQGKGKDVGFTVRRYDEELFITQVTHEDRVRKGWKITHLDGKSIGQLRDKYTRYLDENHAEREKWRPILEQSTTCTIKKENGEKEEIELQLKESHAYKPEYSLKEVEEGTYLIKMTDFGNPDAIYSLVDKYSHELKSAKALIFDVRFNLGGSDSSYFPFFPYIFPEQGTELAPDPTDGMLFNCTKNNADRQLASINEEEQIESEEAQKFVRFFRDQWKQNRGKGFVEFPFQEIMPETMISGFAQPEQIIVLTDVFCGSSGDSFVETCNKSSKVLVVGRATMGLNDYANLATLNLDKRFELYYPTSKLMRVDRGEGMTKKGIEPDIYIPWTPEHLIQDIDLIKALDVLKMRNRK